MTWLTWLGLAVVLAAVAAITGIKPKGSRHVAHTKLMGVGRVVLVILAIVLALVAFKARGAELQAPPAEDVARAIAQRLFPGAETRNAAPIDGDATFALTGGGITSQPVPKLTLTALKNGRFQSPHVVEGEESYVVPQVVVGVRLLDAATGDVQCGFAILEPALGESPLGLRRLDLHDAAKDPVLCGDADVDEDREHVTFTIDAVDEYVQPRRWRREEARCSLTTGVAEHGAVVGRPMASPTRSASLHLAYSSPELARVVWTPDDDAIALPPELARATDSLAALHPVSVLTAGDSTTFRVSVGDTRQLAALLRALEDDAGVVDVALSGQGDGERKIATVEYRVRATR